MIPESCWIEIQAAVRFRQFRGGREQHTTAPLAYKAAVDLIARMHLPEGREDFHRLSWLGYANLMLGEFDEARENVDRAKQAADRNPPNERGTIPILETENDDSFLLDA